MSIDPGGCGVLEKFKSELHNWIICACACVCDCVLCIVCCMCVHVCCILFVLLPGLTKVEMAALGSGATSEDVDMAQAMHFLFVIINVCVCACVVDMRPKLWKQLWWRLKLKTLILQN